MLTLGGCLPSIKISGYPPGHAWDIRITRRSIRPHHCTV